MHPLILTTVGVAGLLLVRQAGAFTPSPEDVSRVNAARNLAAFKAVIRQGESSDDYFALVGGGEFIDYSDHPAVTGEFAGIRRADGRLTTAAGGYQFTRTRWLALGGIERFGDFSPAAQDAAAEASMIALGAMPDVLAGRVFQARRKLAGEWEIFARSYTDERTLSAFESFGGVSAA